MTNPSSLNFVAVGDNCLDVFLTKGLMTVGGNALNVAAQWCRNGWQSRYFGAVGNDAEGEALLEEIEKIGLAPSDVDFKPGDTAVTLLREEAGDRQFLLESFGVGENFMPSEAHYRIICTADWVHLGTNANPDLVRRLVADRAPFSLDVSTAHLALPLKGVPLVFASGPDDVRASVAPIFDTIKAAGGSQVVVTCGSRGAYMDDGKARYHAAADPVRVFDTCGAGDSFIATFLSATRGEGLAPPEALRKAASAASETCTHLGGFPQQPRKIPDWLLAKYASYIAPAEAR
ncbi:PfkB family carbohydrate kinase [Dongia rigui]|uniref:PfkB family carbohydrate kinase n=1 Tax=Dongia rigui TaxID=940149 RepID=A0ABU5E3M1_9PROT|nr:PfkB family carbohydrate kinase [Dongia rigui]MDY0873785.1 PfkB family carbohydrate kinase [Dongia rigui]